MDTTTSNPDLMDNPLVKSWDSSGEFPPFSQVKPEHFEPAFKIAMDAQRAELALIANHADGTIADPTFANTIEAFDRTGARLSRITLLFENLIDSASTPDLQQVELALAGPRAAFATEVLTNTALFQRIDALFVKQDALGLTEEQRQLLNRFHLDFVRAGARLSGPAKQKLGEIIERLAQLSAKFSQNVLGSENAFTLELKGPSDTAGLPDYLIAAAKEAAIERNMPDTHVITLSRSLVVPFLTFATNRALRKQAFQAWTQRAENDARFDTRPLIKEILALRLAQANLLGYKSFADYACDDRMARTPEAARQLVEQAWEPAKRKANAELRDMSVLAKAQGMSEPIEPWDWRFYAEKVRQERYAITDEETKPFFSLRNMNAAMFDCATQLFGITFNLLPDAPAYHPDVKTYQVSGQSGNVIGYFLADNFSRQSKRGGAWMSAYRTQAFSLDNRLPIISNNNNFARAKDPDLTLLSVSDVTTLFHEFGHGLHGLLSQVHSQRLSGTNVLQDFVELPSQLMEHWAMNEQVLKKHARHYLTNEPISSALLAKIKAAERFNQGFETSEYCACALVDLSLHQQTDIENLDLNQFETTELNRLGMPQGIVMRHRLAHFGHLFSGNYYAAGYYVYLWAEVLDADAFDAFEEAGDIFDAATAKRLKECIYAAGGSVDPMTTYLAFRGRAPTVAPMLRNRGLAPA